MFDGPIEKDEMEMKMREKRRRIPDGWCAVVFARCRPFVRPYSRYGVYLEFDRDPCPPPNVGDRAWCTVELGAPDSAEHFERFLDTVLSEEEIPQFCSNPPIDQLGNLVRHMNDNVAQRNLAIEVEHGEAVDFASADDHAKSIGMKRREIKAASPEPEVEIYDLDAPGVLEKFGLNPGDVADSDIVIYVEED